MKLKLPKKLRAVFEGKTRYRGARGGRGSAKSRTFATMALLRGMEKKHKVLCARELQTSIRESVHAELCDLIDELELSWFYRYGESYIVGINGTEFIYKGLRSNSQAVKSTKGVTICWVEEAEYVSEKSWKDLIPTIRAPGSEIWLTWNPERKDSPTKKRFIDNPPSDAKIVEINFRDNPWFPEELEKERIDDLRRDPDSYQHVWEGQCITRSDAQIFNGKWIVQDFDVQADWNGPYDGADWGFAADPTVRIRCWVSADNKFLYVEREAYGLKTELQDLPELFDQFPSSRRYKIRADNARPETISYMKKGNFNEEYIKRTGMTGGFVIEAAEKWPGSVEDGIEFMRGKFDKIIIHSRCQHTAEEMRLYSYKVDRLTDDILTDIIDKHNHCIDAIRYALGPLIKRKGKGFFT